MTFSYQDLAGLPEPVQRYFRYALQDNQPYMRYVVLHHKGLFRPRTNLGLRADEGWKKVTAQQYISAAEPGTSFVPLRYLSACLHFLDCYAHANR